MCCISQLSLHICMCVHMSRMVPPPKSLLHRQSDCKYGCNQHSETVRSQRGWIEKVLRERIFRSTSILSAIEASQWSKNLKPQGNRSQTHCPLWPLFERGREDPLCWATLYPTYNITGTSFTVHSARHFTHLPPDLDRSRPLQEKHYVNTHPICYLQWKDLTYTVVHSGPVEGTFNKC